MMYITKELADAREQLVFGQPYDPKSYEMGGCKRFDRLSLNSAKDLVNLGLLDLADRQNDSPEARDMLDFVEDHGDGWYVHGYVISPTRDDCRVTLEGVGYSGEPLSMDDLLDFVDAFRFADEFEVGKESAWCWYD